MSDLVQGLGNNQLWGFTPCLDLQEIVPASSLFSFSSCFQLFLCRFHPPLILSFWSFLSGRDPLHVLLLGSADIRHVLKTIAFSQRHPAKPINVSDAASSFSLFAFLFILQQKKTKRKTRIKEDHWHHLNLSLHLAFPLLSSYVSCAWLSFPECCFCDAGALFSSWLNIIVCPYSVIVCFCLSCFQPSACLHVFGCSIIYGRTRWRASLALCCLWVLLLICPFPYRVSFMLSFLLLFFSSSFCFFSRWWVSAHVYLLPCLVRYHCLLSFLHDSVFSFLSFPRFSSLFLSPSPHLSFSSLSCLLFIFSSFSEHVQFFLELHGSKLWHNRQKAPEWKRRRMDLKREERRLFLFLFSSFLSTSMFLSDSRM